MPQYKVRTGDNWGNIASKYNVDIQTLIRANQGIAGKPQAGTYVYIPTGYSPQQTQAYSSPASLLGRGRRTTGRRGALTQLEPTSSIAQANPMTQAGVIGNQYAQSWWNQQQPQNPLTVSPYQPTSPIVPLTPIQQAIASQQQTMAQAQIAQPTAPVQAQPVAPIQAQPAPQAPVQGPPPPPAGTVWGPENVSVTTPISSTNLYEGNPQYYYGGYDPVNQTVNYINAESPVFYDIAYGVQELLSQGIAPSIISPQVQYLLGFTDEELANAGYVQQPYGQWTPGDIPETGTPTDYIGGGGNPYTEYEPYRGRTGYMGQQLYTGRGRTGAADRYASGMGAVSWRI